MFKNLKAGDEVYLVRDNDLQYATKKKIAKITNKRIILTVFNKEDISFDIKTGEITKTSQYIKDYRSSYNKSKIMLVNNENTKLINDEKLKNLIIERLKILFVSDTYLSKEVRIKRDSLTLEQLVKVAEILEIEVK